MAASLDEVATKPFSGQLLCFSKAFNPFLTSVGSLQTQYEKEPKVPKGALQVFLKPIERKFDRIEAIWEMLEGNDEEWSTREDQQKNRAYYQQKFSNAQNEYADWITKVHNRVDAVLVPNSGVIANAPTSNQARNLPRITDNLRPFTLNLDHHYTKFVEWKRDFEAYAKFQRFSERELDAQQRLLYECLDSNIRTEIEASVTETTELFLPKEPSEKTIFTIIGDLFLQKYPLLNRRRDLFRLEQDSIESEREFAKRVDLSIEASNVPSAGLKIEDIFCAVYVGGLTEENLKIELFKIKPGDISKKKFLEVVTTEISSKAAANSASAASGRIQNIDVNESQYRNKKKSAMNKKHSENISSDQNSRQEGRGSKSMNLRDVTCFNCGEKNHFDSQCCSPRDEDRIAENRKNFLSQRGRGREM